MIKRIWHGWTTPENAENYQSLLTTTIIPMIEEKHMPGYVGIELLRRENEGEVEFITIMKFESLESVKDFVGDDYEVAHVPEMARAVLNRWDERSQHYKVVLSKNGMEAEK